MGLIDDLPGPLFDFDLMPKLYVMTPPCLTIKTYHHNYCRQHDPDRLFAYEHFAL